MVAATPSAFVAAGGSSLAGRWSTTGSAEWPMLRVTRQDRVSPGASPHPASLAEMISSNAARCPA